MEIDWSKYKLGDRISDSYALYNIVKLDEPHLELVALFKFYRMEMYFIRDKIYFINKYASDIDIGPKLYDYEFIIISNTPREALITEKLDKTLTRIYESLGYIPDNYQYEIINMVEKISSLYFYHRDLHSDNIMTTKSNGLKFIDFEYYTLGREDIIKHFRKNGTRLDYEFFKGDTGFNNEIMSKIDSDKICLIVQLVQLMKFFTSCPKCEKIFDRIERLIYDISPSYYDVCLRFTLVHNPFPQFGNKFGKLSQKYLYYRKNTYPFE